MNLIDILILVPLLFFAFRGFKNGFVKEIFGLIGLVLAVFFSFEYMAEFGALIRQQLETDSPYIPYFAFGIIFLLVLLAVQIVIYFVEGLLSIVFLSLPNRLLGSLFCAFKSALVISIILLLFSGFALPDDEARSESLFYPYIIKVAPITYNAVGRLYPGASSYLETIQEAFEQHSPAIPID